MKIDSDELVIRLCKLSPVVDDDLLVVGYRCAITEVLKVIAQMTTEKRGEV